MKVKVRGLVFVGFAAAVFASSALAATPEQIAADKKTVTSKYYVDTTFQTLNNLTTSTETLDWTSDTEYPSMKVVETRVGALTPAVGSPNATDYLNFSKEGNTLTVDLDNAPATAATDLTGAVNGETGLLTAPTGNDLKKLVTAGAVNALIEAETAANTHTITGAAAENGTVPTTKNVYDFVTSAISTAGQDYQRKLDSNETGLYVGTYSAENANTWKALEGAAAANSQASTDYVTIMENDGVYDVNIPSAQIASSIVTSGSAKLATEGAVYALVDREATSGNTTITALSASETLVPTSKNVYDFVTTYTAGAYQVQNGTAAPMVGYGNDWRQLSASGTTGASGNTYVVMQEQTNGNVTSYMINLAADAITTTGNAIALYTDQNNGDVNDLTTVKAVKEYVTGLTGGLTIPSMPGNCTSAATNGGYCALVYGDTDGNGTLGLQWTVMAQPTGN